MMKIIIMALTITITGIPMTEQRDQRCDECLRRSWMATLARNGVSDVDQQLFMQSMEDILQDEVSENAPELQRQLSMLYGKITSDDDPFRLQKQFSNTVASQLAKEWQAKINADNDPFNLSLRLALAANIIDYGAASHFNLQQTIERVLKSPLAIDQTELLRKKIQTAKSILYLGDNAGEIFFDKLFLEVIAHPSVTFVVRGGPALNDATLEDALLADIQDIAKPITNGYNAPSTIPEKGTEDFRHAFDKADLIISKGMGNLEGLMHRQDNRIFFLLMAKCEVIADYLSVSKGSFVVAENTFIATL